MEPGDLPSEARIELERTASNTRIIEIVFGIFGAFGLGWLYAGNITTAIILLVFSIFYATIVWSIVTLSLGLCACLAIPLGFVIAFVSGNNARAWAMKTRAQGSVMRLLVGLAIVVAAVFLGVILLGASFAALFSQYNPVQ